MKAYGIDGELVQALKEDPELSALEPALRPLFKLARKMTEGAWRVTDSDFEAARAAGWDDEAIEDAVLVTCLFNFMNRLVSTLGIEADASYLAGAGERIRDEGYSGSLEKASRRREP